MYMVGGEADYKALLGHDALFGQTGLRRGASCHRAGGRAGVNIRMGETDCENWNRIFKSCDKSRNHFFRVEVSG